MSESKHKIRISIRRDAFAIGAGMGWRALVYRDIGQQPDRLIDREVLAADGKWREKGPVDAIFDDEQFDVEVIE